MPRPSSLMAICTNSPCSSSYSPARVRLQAARTMLPCSSMASRALMTRLSKTISSWLESTSISRKSGLSSMRNSMALGKACLSSRWVDSSNSGRLTVATLSSLRRANVSSCWVSCVPRSPASRICVSSLLIRSGSLLFIARRAEPRIMVRILLKSWAMPPVSWPSASSFCAWNSWARTLSSSMAASCLSVMSRVILARPMTSPSVSRTTSRAARAQNRVPSLRTRQPSSCAPPVSSARPSNICGNPAARSSGVKNMEKCWPITSSARYPLMRCAPAFQLTISPLRSSM
ncbi:hypothetical protein D3C86_1450640 [compost metagenome]